MPKISASDEGFKLATKVLEETYAGLMDPPFLCLFQDTVIKKGGSPVAATLKVVKADSDEGHFANIAFDCFGQEEPQDFYKIKISKPIWDRLNQDQKKYVIDHEWSHARRDENNRLSSKGHDIEENFEVMKRWPLNIMKDVYTMARIVEDKLKRGERLDEPQNSFDFADVTLLAPKRREDEEDEPSGVDSAIH